MKRLKFLLSVVLMPLSLAVVAEDLSSDDWRYMPNITLPVGEDGVERFDLTRFKSKGSVSKETLAGTWVAVWDIDQQRSDILAAPFVMPELKTSRLELLVIRQAGQGFEMGHCFGNGMEPVKISGDKLTTASRNLIIHNNTTMALEENYAKSVTMPALVGDWKRSYNEKASLKANYVKISDSVEPVGSLSQYWSTANNIIEKDIYCSSLNTMNDGTIRVYVGSDDDMKYVISTSIDPSEPTAVIDEPKFKGEGEGSIDTGIELCMAAIDVLEARPNDIMFQYYVVNQQTGEAVYGDAFLKLPVR